VRIALVVALGGCNAIFGLAPVQLGSDGGARDDAGAVDGASADAFPATQSGAIVALSEVYQSGGGTMVGYYAAAAIGHPAPTCSTPVVAGGCSTEQCTGATDPGPWPNAGTISISGTSMLLMSPSLDGSYPTQEAGSTILFTDDQQVTIAANGGDVPGWSTPITAPTAVQFAQQQGLAVASSPAMLVRQTGLQLTWTPTPIGDVVIDVVASDGSRMRCAFPAAAGDGMLEPTALLALPAGAGTMQAVVATHTLLLSGSFQIDLDVAVAARRVAGDWVNGSVTLQ